MSQEDKSRIQLYTNKLMALFEDALNGESRANSLIRLAEFKKDFEAYIKSLDLSPQEQKEVARVLVIAQQFAKLPHPDDVSC